MMNTKFRNSFMSKISNNHLKLSQSKFPRSKAKMGFQFSILGRNHEKWNKGSWKIGKMRLLPMDYMRKMHQESL